MLSQEEVRSVSSLLATRCEAYDLIYDQLVKNVGLESRGNNSMFFNISTVTSKPVTTITANPTNTTNATSNSSSKSKAVNAGMGAAAIAAAGLVGFVLVKLLRGGGSSGGSRRRGGSSSSSSQPVKRIPKGRGGREMVLVSQLSVCTDELRKAAHNENLLKDDWRLGRVRLAWPPAPEPPGYDPLQPNACNVTTLLQDMYG